MDSPKNVPKPRIVELASIISKSVANLERILFDHHAPWPSFEEDCPAHLPQEAAEVQGTVLGMLYLGHMKLHIFTYALVSSTVFLDSYTDMGL